MQKPRSSYRLHPMESNAGEADDSDVTALFLIGCTKGGMLLVVTAIAAVASPPRWMGAWADNAWSLA